MQTFAAESEIDDRDDWLIPVEKTRVYDTWLAESERANLLAAKGWPEELFIVAKAGHREFITTYRIYRAVQQLREYVEIDPLKRGGVPVLRGTRFKLAQLFAQLADGDSVDTLVENLNLDGDLIRELLHSVAVILDRRVENEHHPT